LGKSPGGNAIVKGVKTRNQGELGKKFRDFTPFYLTPLRYLGSAPFQIPTQTTFE
jgi:hypothetical protein